MRINLFSLKTSFWSKKRRESTDTKGHRRRMIAVYNTLLRNSRGLLNVPTHVINARETADQLVGSIVRSARRNTAVKAGHAQMGTFLAAARPISCAKM